MQTFLPLEGFAETAAVLDPRRLGKQRVEALQVLRALTVPGYGWRHHPAVRMWIGYPEAFARYGLEICEVWRRAGRPDTCAVALAAELAERCRVLRVRSQRELAAAGEVPPWLGMAAFHRSHRSALVRKDPTWYRRYFPDIEDDLPNVWPRSDRDPAARSPELPHQP